MDKNKQIIEQIVEKIKNKFGPEKIILFGSYAWGNPGKDSDIDFFVVKNTCEPPRERNITLRKILNEENAESALELLVYTPEEVSNRLKMGDPFIKKIISQGKVLYEQ